MIAQLVTEPFGISHATIATLTDRQIVDHYFHPRDEEGRLDFGGGGFEADESLAPEQVRAQLRAMAEMAGIVIEEGKSDVDGDG